MFRMQTDLFFTVFSVKSNHSQQILNERVTATIHGDNNAAMILVSNSKPLLHL